MTRESGASYAMGAANTPNWAEVTAIFGGTFDPPHAGHREAVRGLFEAPGVRRVLILPTASPPHKPCFTRPEHRVEMVRRCFSDLPGSIEIDLTEIERSSRNPGHFNYSHDTLLELGQKFHGSDKIAFVIGADQLAAIASWYRFPEILGLCHWIVLARKPDGLDIAAQAAKKLEASGLASSVIGTHQAHGIWLVGPIGQKHFLKLVPTRAPDVSSTRIREGLNRSGIAPDGSLPPEVEAYLKLHHLYGT